MTANTVWEKGEMLAKQKEEVRKRHPFEAKTLRSETRGGSRVPPPRVRLPI